MFAGPNGSGKSTICDELKDEWIGVYVNADEIESALKQPAGLNLDALDLMLGEAELTVQLMAFFRSSVLLKSADLGELGYRIVIFPGGTARFVAAQLQRYFARLSADGTTQEMRGEMLDFDQLNGVIGTPQLLALGEAYARDGAR